MFQFFSKWAFFGFTVALSASATQARAIGTKFACCAMHHTSTLGSGSCVYYNNTLQDRALTQFDAQARCGTQKMVWTTHECPAPSSGCSSPAPAPKTCSGFISFANTTNGPISFNILNNKSWKTETLAANEIKDIHVITDANSSGSCTGAYTQVSHDWLYEAGSQTSPSSVFIGGRSSFEPWREGQKSWADTDPNKKIIGILVRNY